MSQALYRAGVAEFVHDALHQQLHDQLSASLAAESGQAPSEGERKSWQVSLAELASVLVAEPALVDAAVIVEQARSIADALVIALA